MKTYLVTGAAGFIGANYIKYILAKHDDIKVVILDARIGQGIHINDTALVIVFFEHVMNVVGTDKAGTACYQISSHFLSVLRRCAHFAIDSDILP